MQTRKNQGLFGKGLTPKQPTKFKALQMTKQKWLHDVTAFNPLPHFPIRPKVLWENLKTITNNDAPVQQIPSNLCINDTLVEGTESVNIELNKHFANISDIIDRGPFDDGNFKRLKSHLNEKLSG